MTRKEMKRSLRSAVLSATPQVLDRVLAVEDDSSVIEFRRKPDSPPKPKTAFRMAACTIAAAIVLCVAVLYSVHPQMDSLVSIDVNPGMELSIDAADRVLDYRALNSDAEKVLDGMDLKQKKLDTATDEIVNSLIRYGYLEANSQDNAILISVANNDTKRVEHLQKTVAVSVNTVLKENNAKAVVLQQNESLTKDLRTFADENQISVGKADFVRKLAEKDPDLETEHLTDLSIKELALLVNENQIDISDVVTEYDEDNTADEEIEDTESHHSGSDRTPSKDSAENSSSVVSNAPDGAGRTEIESDVNSKPESEKQPPESTSAPPVSSPESAPEEPPTPSTPIPGPVEPPPLPIEPTVPPDDTSSPVKDSGDPPGGNSGSSDTSKESSSVQDANDSSTSETGDAVSTPPFPVSGTGANSSQKSSSRIQDLGLYCEYCGRPSMICKGECSHSKGKRYCKYCGKLQKVCKGSCIKGGLSNGNPAIYPKPPGFIPNQDSHEAAKN